jgi:integrase
LPPYAKKNPEYDGMAYREIADLNERRYSDGEEVELNERTSHNKYFGSITKFFNWAKDNHMIDRHPAEGIRFPGEATTKRRAFTNDEIGKLFHAAYRPLVNTWLPLLCCFQGFRPKEAAQLDAVDVLEYEGHWCISIMDSKPFTTNGKGEKDKTVKTKQSRRTVPVHRRLVDLGFLDFAQQRQKDGHDKLFNVLRWKSNGAPNYYESIRDQLTAMVKDVGIYREQEVVIYSCRHSWTDATRQIQMPIHITETLGGWGSSGSAEKGYGKKVDGRVERVPMGVLKEWLDQIDHPGLFQAAPPAGWRQEEYERVGKNGNGA